MNIFEIERILRQAKMGTVVCERLGAISVFVDECYENCENYGMIGLEAGMRITRLLRQEGLEARRRRRR